MRRKNKITKRAIYEFELMRLAAKRDEENAELVRQLHRKNEFSGGYLAFCFWAVSEPRLSSGAGRPIDLCSHGRPLPIRDGECVDCLRKEFVVHTVVDHFGKREVWVKRTQEV